MLGSVLKRIFGSGSTATTLYAGMAAYERGDLAYAGRLLGALLQEQPDNAEAQLYAGLVSYRSERYGEALQHFECAGRLDPANPKYRYNAAAAEYLMGNVEAASKRCEAALELDPDEPSCLNLMARIALPGPDYFEVLSLIHSAMRPRTYVEVGVYAGQSLVRALPETLVVGIDPDPRIDFPLPANTAVYPLTSDQYFATRAVAEDLNGQPIDLAFIDGMHRFEYALHDFINIEKHCTARSIVLLHDCYPFNRRTAERMRTLAFSSGDVWRLLLILKKYRPDIAVNTIATAPTGLAVLHGLDPESSVLERNFQDIVAEFMAVDYGVLDSDKAGMLNLFPNDRQRIAELVRLTTR